jgi:hypothetical protein
LHKAASNPESLKVILELYPEKDRLEAVRVTNNDEDTVLHKAASNPESLKVILELLPEKDRLALLKIKIDTKSVLELFCTQGINNLSKDDAFKNSFAPDFIAISIFLAEQKKLEANKTGLFCTTTGASELMDSLNKMNTFDEIKNHLSDYVKNNPESSLIKGLIQLGIKDSLKEDSSLKHE